MQIDPWEGIKLLCLCLGASTPSEDPCATIISGKPGHGPRPSSAALKALFSFEFQDFSKVIISLQFIRFSHHQGVGLESPQTTPCPSLPLKHSTTSCPWGIAWVSVTVMLWEKKDCSFLQSLAQHLLGSKQELKCPVSWSTHLKSKAAVYTGTLGITEREKAQDHLYLSGQVRFLLCRKWFWPVAGQDSFSVVCILEMTAVTHSFLSCDTLSLCFNLLSFVMLQCGFGDTKGENTKY